MSILSCFALHCHRPGYDGDYRHHDRLHDGCSVQVVQRIIKPFSKAPSHFCRSKIIPLASLAQKKKSIREKSLPTRLPLRQEKRGLHIIQSHGVTTNDDDMRLPTLILTLAAASISGATSAYPITGDDVNCRRGPSTHFAVVRTYERSTNVTLTCQARGQDIFGNTLWDKTTDGCYVSDYYVDTGGDSDEMVVGTCDPYPPPDGSSAYQGGISRSEILARGAYWISQKVPYSMTATYPDRHGRLYRTDCSGFVSMALHAASPGYNTVSLPEVAEPISWDQLRPGDFVGTLGPGTGGADGHVTLFLSWADEGRTEYNTLECKGGGDGCLQYKRPVGWTVGSFVAKPYWYTKVID
ncbi:hypothetical protein QBC44DRAFT_331316 [Cladorrhinum sp. PSN332]|nr:hypothetical protein QBC44DRAFT_331316 [Cladorrhinum sp. PSN332]